MTDPPDEGGRFVSTGRLPDPQEIAHLVSEAHARFAPLAEGSLSTVYPALAQVDPTLFGICVTGVHGRVYSAGDVDEPFPLMSVAKPFVFALVCESMGAEAVRARVGANATGLAFNSPSAIDRSPDGRTNPMVNAGALVTTSLLPGEGEEKWEALVACLSAFAGRRLELDADTYASAAASNFANRALIWLLHSRGLLGCDPDLALDLYTRQSCLRVTAHDLATMGATLADGGVNPVTGERVVGGTACHHTLAVMLTAGMYETSGDWLFDVGQPGKSGISGGIVTVAPGKGGVGTFSPPLDAAGNSVRGQAAVRFLARELGLDLLQSAPVRPARTAG